jgi:hypothetical protein
VAFGGRQINLAAASSPGTWPGVLARINDHINPRLYELPPWNWKPLPAGDNKIAA